MDLKHDVNSVYENVEVPVSCECFLEMHILAHL